MSVPTAPVNDARDEKKRATTLRWVVTICALALVFDGYDLVVYGTVVPVLLRDPSHIGAVSPNSPGSWGVTPSWG